MNIGLMVHILGRVTMIGVLGNKKILREPRNMPTKTLEYLKIKKEILGIGIPNYEFKHL
jgi:hypothetical protein